MGDGRSDWRDEERPLPFVPSADGVRLALAIRGLWWELDTVAYLLPAGRCSVERMRNLAAVLRGLADHVDGVSGVVPGDLDQPPGEPGPDPV